MDLIPEVQQLLADGAAALAIFLTFLLVPLMLGRQLHWFGWGDQSREGNE